MIKLFYFILSISFIAMNLFSNEVFAMTNSYKMSCCSQIKEHKKCCSKKDKKHYPSADNKTSKNCDQKSNPCLCINFLSTTSTYMQYVDSATNFQVSLSLNYILTDDKKPSLVYLDMWLLPKIDG
ncbi:MAG: hypothetical protein ACRCR9_02455 [Chitinophagaceae bacterium]